MIKKLYHWLHRLTSNPEEREEYSGGYWQDMVRRQSLALCQGIKGKILEIGCGEGLFLSQLALQNPKAEIWGIDNNKDRLVQAEKRFSDKNLPNIRLSLQEAPNLSFADEYFDIIFCINVFFNMASLDLVEQTLTQMQRITKKGGRILFDFRNALNPLLKVKYKLARHYDDSVANLPLNAYRLKNIESILFSLGFRIIQKKFCGFFLKSFAPIIIIEAEKC